MDKVKIHNKFQEWYELQRPGIPEAYSGNLLEGLKIFAEHAYTQGCLDTLKSLVK